MRVADRHPGPGHASPIVHVALRADGQRLASCSYDGQVLVWETSTPTALSRLFSLRHGRRVLATDWNPSAANLLATASTDRIAAVWRIVDDRPPLCLTVLNLPSDIAAVLWTADGTGLVCLTSDGQVTLWDASSATPLGPVGRRRSRCVMMALSSDGSVATVSDEDIVEIGDLNSQRPRGLRQYASTVGACAWSPSGSTLAVARPDGRVELLSPELDLIAAFEVPASVVRSIVWTGSDDHLLVGGCDGSLHLLDRDGRRLWHTRNVWLWPMSMSATSRLAAVGSLLPAPGMLRLTRR